MIKKADIVLAVSIFLVTCLLTVAFFVFSDKGDTVVVTVDGETFSKVPLDEDNTIDVETKYGKNTVVIKDGYVSVSTADCPDKYCVSHIKIDSVGQTIVCLPHKMVVEIRGDGNG